MALNLTRTMTRSGDPGRIELDDDTAKAAPTGSVGDDGRVDVQFHENPQALEAWFRRVHSHLGDDPAAAASDSGAPGDAAPDGAAPGRPAKPRRQSSFALPILEAEQARSTSPRLCIAIHIVGSRGDVQPFIPIAQMLSRAPYGHRVRICTHPVFRDFVEAQGVEFFSIGGDPEALMAYMVRNPGLLPSLASVRAGDVGKRRREMWEIMTGAWRSCIEAGDGRSEEPVKAANVRRVDDLFVADAIIANPPSMAHIHCAEKLGIPLHMVFTMPWSPTQSFSHPLASMSYGEADRAAANYLSFMMLELLTWEGLGDLINKLRTQVLHLDPISPMWGYQLLPRLRVPYSYLWSPALIPKPVDWGPHINIAGFSFLKLASSYAPPPELTAFLEAGPTPIYIGFGSIVIDDPQALTELIFEAVRLTGVRALLSKGWGGVGAEDAPENVFMIGNCPHDWLFQRVSAVVHHGGAGTTAAGIATGCPTVVVPFFGDQPFWGQMIARAGAGPTPVPFKEMTAESLAESIRFALRPETKEAASKMAESVAEEDGAGGAAKDVQERLDIDDLRCDVCPERLAHWRHKPTGAHLSGFAVATLIEARLIQPEHIKILRHRQWYVDEGAEHPIIGAIAAATGLFSAIGTAVGDYSDALKARPRKWTADEESQTEKTGADTPAAVLKTVLVTPDGDESTLTNPSVPSVPSMPTTEACKTSAKTMTPVQMEAIALRMATKSVRSTESRPTALAQIAPTLYKRKEEARQRRREAKQRKKEACVAKEQGRNGHRYYIARVTGRLACDLTKAGFKAPVAFFYNIANGCHNLPSYSFAHSVEVRRRDEITGFGSGVRTAAKEFVLGFYEGFSGVVMLPYKGARADGAKGFGAGIFKGMRGFFCNVLAAVYGLPGYSLKGLEKSLHKRHLTKLKAELTLVRLRQGIEDYRNGTADERETVCQRWRETFPGK